MCAERYTVYSKLKHFHFLTGGILCEFLISVGFRYYLQGDTYLKNAQVGLTEGLFNKVNNGSARILTHWSTNHESGIQSMLCQWLFLLAAPLSSSTECILIGVSSQSSQQRRCAYHVTDKGGVYTTAGNVSGSVQLCKNTWCCVGYYVVIDGRLKADVLGEEIQTRTTGLHSKGMYVHAHGCAVAFFCCSLR